MESTAKLYTSSPFSQLVIVLWLALLTSINHNSCHQCLVQLDNAQSAFTACHFIKLLSTNENWMESVEKLHIYCFCICMCVVGMCLILREYELYIQ